MCVPDAKSFALPPLLGAIPGRSAFATAIMKKEMENLHIPPLPNSSK